MAALLCAAIALYSFRYLPEIGPLPEGILANTFYRPNILIAELYLRAGPAMPRLSTAAVSALPERGA